MIIRKITALAISSVLVLSFSRCSQDDSVPAQTNFTLSATATGAKEVPANTATGTGSVSGTYNSNTNALTYTVNWTGLTGVPTAMHFHGPATTTTTASPVVTISGFPSATTGTYSGTATLTDAQEADLLAGKWYWNAHTATNTGGEIRGQIEVH